MDWASVLRIVPDFPKPGINFYDLSPLLADAAAFQAAIDQLADRIRPSRPDRICGIESRGFLLAAPLALALGAGCVMIRKPGKLPGTVLRRSYQLEYGQDTLEVQTDFLHPDQRIVLVDDVLATGGTLRATIELLEALPAPPCAAYTLLELEGLGGRDALKIPCTSLLRVPA